MADSKKTQIKNDLAKLESCSDLERSIQLAKQANELCDPTLPFLHSMQYTEGDLDLSFYFSKSYNLKNIHKEEIFSLFKANMYESYKNCPWGWREKKKRSEMFHQNARYILVRQTSSKKVLVAFVHFRFDIEDLTEVLYLYEIQLKQEVRSKGLGRYLMNFLETMAIYYNMKRVVLTVLKNDNKVINFYLSQNYKIESYSPKNSFYYILSKLLIKNV
ncbi:N-alpha-acetyltransferase 40 [Adelges cooleyi]|uniref:N-alpha-acetyltransferase 40 n=1 Tax=Adelges cooleyi TaxID=133065 RepID=UPI00217F312D|nr:N-alpha-acetyltransferase 40 [Adelges cooleyi]XP_050424125.1 N-alpha-acetyltransferase 40 [Adelges cooleyi]